MRRLAWILALLMPLSSIRPAVLRAATTCWVRGVRVITAKSCQCANNACPASTNELHWYNVCAQAAPGESGRTECFVKMATVGVSYACEHQNDILAIAACMAGNVVCVATCAMITPSTAGAGLAACLGCFAALGIACGQECVVVDCAVNQQITSPIIRHDVLHHFSGESCEGSY